MKFKKLTIKYNYIKLRCFKIILESFIWKEELCNNICQKSQFCISILNSIFLKTSFDEPLERQKRRNYLTYVKKSTFDLYYNFWKNWPNARAYNFWLNDGTSLELYFLLVFSSHLDDSIQSLNYHKCTFRVMAMRRITKVTTVVRSIYEGTTRVIGFNVVYLLMFNNHSTKHVCAWECAHNSGRGVL